MQEVRGAVGVVHWFRNHRFTLRRLFGRELGKLEEVFGR